MDVVASTQEVAHLLAEGGATHGSAVVAREQHAGRGTRGRTWHSPIGGLWMSVICRPRDPVSAECFSIRVGLGVAAVLEAWTGEGHRVMVKWPNDLYLGGRKLGGILCEARWQGPALAWIVAGIGINVANRLPIEVRDSAVTLASVVPGLTPDQLAPAVADRVSRQAEAGGPLGASELLDFSRRDFLHGRRLQGPLTGMANGIDAMGGLIVVAEDGETRVATGGTVELS